MTQLKEGRIAGHMAFYIFLLFFLIQLATLSGLNFNVDSGSERIELVRAIVDRHELELNKGDLKGVSGRIYPLRAIAPALLAIPFYLLEKIISSPDAAGAVAIVNQLCGAATVMLIYSFSMVLGYSRKASLLTAIFYGFGTFAWPSSKSSFEHTIETFFVLFSVYSMYQYSVFKSVSNIFLSGISFGLAFNTRYTSVLIIPALFLMMILHYLKKYDMRESAKYLGKDAVLFTVAFMPFMCLFFWYNFSRFGSFFETGYTLQAKRLGVDFFSGTSMMTGLAGFLISPGKGFFYYSPVTVLFFLSIGRFLKSHLALALSFIVIIACHLLFLSKNLYWHGDWAWGPRYILVITPFLMIPVADFLDSHQWRTRKIVRGAVYCLFIISVVIQLAAISVDFNKYFFHLIFDEHVVFVNIHGAGVQPIIEPPSGSYVDWRKSPILWQFKFIVEMAKDIDKYQYVKVPERSPLREKIVAEPFMHLYDFWWLHQYFITRRYSGFVIAGILFLVAVFIGIRLFRASGNALEQ